jgi:hypothetical protein
MSEIRQASAGEAPGGGCFMKTHRIIFGAFLVLVPPVVLMARPYIQQVSVPPPGQYGIENLWNVTLNNPDSTTYEVWLEGTIAEAARGQVFWAKTNKFLLPRGTRVIRYADVQSIGIDQQTYAPGYKDFAARTGGLPEGNYTFTVRLEPSFGDRPSPQFSVKPVGPPRLVTPRDGTKLPQAEKYPVFGWTPPRPPVPGVRYALRVAEVLPGQTKEDAVRSNRAWHAQKGMKTPSLRYPQSARAFEKDRRYAWQVQAMTGTSAIESEVWEFSFGAEGFLELGMVPRDGDTVSSTTVIALTATGLDTLLNRCVFSVSVERGKWIEIGRDEDGTNGWSTVWPTFRVKARGPAFSCLVKVEAFTRSGGRLEQVNQVSVLRY